jgi:cytochrome c-type biogenesis protein CcmH/NrfF
MPTQTSNPQNSTNPGASDGSDFQDTAPSDALNQQTDNLTVETTGEPIVASPKAEDTSLSLAWVVFIVVLVAIGIWMLIRLIQEQNSETKQAVPAAKPAVKDTKKVATKKAPAKKKSSTKTRKKTSKKKR